MPRLSKADQQAKISATEAERRRKVAMAEIRRLEADEKARKLLPAAEVRKVWVDRLGTLRDRVLMLPDRLGARLANRSEVEVRGVLRDDLEECLRGIHADAQAGF